MTEIIFLGLCYPARKSDEELIVRIKWGSQGTHKEVYDEQGNSPLS